MRALFAKYGISGSTTRVRREAAIREAPALVIFDGDCALCAWSVRFITARATPGTFAFAARASPEAGRALAPHPEAAGIDGLLVIAGGRCSSRSDAVLRIAARLRAPWPLAGLFRVLPAGLRDAVYDLIARNRYRWFGRVRGE